MTQKITFDPPPLPLDDYAEGGEKILRARLLDDPSTNPDIEIVTCEYDAMGKYDRHGDNYVWLVHEENGHLKEMNFLPGYWPLPKIKEEKK